MVQIHSSAPKMISRRYRVQEKRTTRNAVLLLLLSAGLLLFLLFFGIPSLINFAVFVSNLKNSSTPIAQEDKTPPIPPQFDEPPRYVKTDKIMVGGRAEAGSTLKLFHQEKLIKETVVDDKSNYSLEVSLDKGENTLFVTATDKAGNESERSAQRTVIYDLEPPTLEVTKPKDGESFSGDNKTIDIEGIVEQDTKVTVNDRLTIVGAGGKFNYKFTLSEGENQIVIIALDPAENKTEKQIKVTYTP